MSDLGGVLNIFHLVEQKFVRSIHWTRVLDTLVGMKRLRYSYESKPRWWNML